MYCIVVGLRSCSGTARRVCDGVSSECGEDVDNRSARNCFIGTCMPQMVIRSADGASTRTDEHDGGGQYGCID